MGLPTADYKTEPQARSAQSLSRPPPRASRGHRGDRMLGGSVLLLLSQGYLDKVRPWQFSEVCIHFSDREVSSFRLCSRGRPGSHPCPATPRLPQVPYPLNLDFFTCRSTCLTGLGERGKEQKGFSMEVGLKILVKLSFAQSPV